MAKTSAKPADKPAAKAPAKPKAPAKSKIGSTVQGTNKDIKTGKDAKKPKAASVKTVSVAKPKKDPKSKPAKAEASTSGIAQFARHTTEAITTLAADILADRIVPTIEQIKAVAAHALGKDKKTKSRPKKSRKK